MEMLKLIGNTPLVFVEEINGNKLYAKLEYFNPTGSIKDRASLYMIKQAIKSGKLNKNGVVIEPTSGNTGIGLAMVCKQYNLRSIFTMPESMSKERRDMISAYGGEIVLTAKELGMQGAVDKAISLCEETENSFMPNQFENLDNPLAHYETTAPEIFSKINPAWIVGGFGTGGTMIGIKNYIIDKKIDTKVCAVEPKESPLVTEGKAGGHLIQGIGANFIPKIFDTTKMDRIVAVESLLAKACAKQLCQKFGIMCGISAGASFLASQRLAQEIKGDIVFIVPDNGARYLSVGLYD